LFVCLFACLFVVVGGFTFLLSLAWPSHFFSGRRRNFARKRSSGPWASDEALRRLVRLLERPRSRQTVPTLKVRTSSRVTRLVECSPFTRLFTLEKFFKVKNSF
jgi:hypothetical protein